MKRTLLPLLFIGLLFLTCKKSKEYKGPVIDIQGFLVTDANGNQMGSIGNPSDDWKLMDWNSLSPKEQSFLSFTDNFTILTDPSTVYEPVAYPNPFNNISSISFRSDEVVKLKIAIVDSMGTVIKTYATLMGDAFTVSLDFSTLITGDPIRRSLRCYYSFSANSPFPFKAGYGDIRLCRGTSGGAPYTECF